MKTLSKKDVLIGSILIGKPRLAISSIESKEKLISIVKPYLEQIPSMLYKIDKPIKFKDANFTSRG